MKRKEEDSMVTIVIKMKSEMLDTIENQRDQCIQSS
jgi:hypothetical protein